MIAVFDFAWIGCDQHIPVGGGRRLYQPAEFLNPQSTHLRRRVILQRHGMRVLTAKDGLDAISVLQDTRPDVILLDIEMPRMDGYEFASHVRNDERYADVSIIMITSRVGDKHRARAIELGHTPTQDFVKAMEKAQQKSVKIGQKEEAEEEVVEAAVRHFAHRIPGRS